MPSSFNKWILHIDMDAFFASVEEVLNPSLRGKPLIVGGDPKKRGVVAAASYAARKYGVRSAMPSAQAKKLCPEAIFLSGSYGRYVEFSDHIFAILNTFSPSVEPMSLDEAYIDLTGCERLNGPTLTTAQHIRDRIKTEVGVDCSIGIAANKLMAKIASAYCKPCGMLWIMEGMEQTFLAPLPIDRIPGIGPKTSTKLWRMGIKTIGQLASLPREILEKKYGQFGIKLYYKSRGWCDSPVENGHSHVSSINRETTFEVDSNDPKFLLSNLSYLVEKAAAQLRASGLKTRCVTIKLRYADFRTVNRSHTLPEISQEDHILYKTAANLFLKLFKGLPPVRLIGVTLTSLTSSIAVQTNLFSRLTPERWEKLYHGIDCIRKKYGFRSILYARTWLSSK